MALLLVNRIDNLEPPQILSSKPFFTTLADKFFIIYRQARSIPYNGINWAEMTKICIIITVLNPVQSVVPWIINPSTEGTDNSLATDYFYIVFKRMLVGFFNKFTGIRF
jgi:hypothetical protein